MKSAACRRSLERAPWRHSLVAGTGSAIDPDDWRRAREFGLRVVRTDLDAILLTRGHPTQAQEAAIPTAIDPALLPETFALRQCAPVDRHQGRFTSNAADENT